MKISSILLSRVIGYVELVDLSPNGNAFLPEIVPKIAEQFSFQKFPQPSEVLDESKGIEFLSGKFETIVVQRLALFSNLIILETRSSTDDSKRILEGMLSWGKGKLGLNYGPDTIKRFAYISDLTFFSDVPILFGDPALTNAAKKVGAELSEIWSETITYEPMNLAAGHDPLARKYGIAPFSIARRAEAKFSENKYFSEAPLPTSSHITILEEYENEVASALKSR
jgi:hypothetical protein